MNEVLGWHNALQAEGVSWNDPLIVLNTHKPHFYSVGEKKNN